METATLPPIDAVGALGVFQLQRLWARALGRMVGEVYPVDPEERHRDFLISHALGVGLEPMAGFLGTRPSFEALEAWILETAGPRSSDDIQRINAAVRGQPIPPAAAPRLAALEAAPDVLSATDLAHWDEHGYLILNQAIDDDACAAAAQAVHDFARAEPDDPASWYRAAERPVRTHGAMLQAFQHPSFEAARRSPRIHKAFAQLWGTADLWMTTDRIGFNPPERPGQPFPGPGLHWDCALKSPVAFTTQAVLYLTDTAADQGAFTCVPGFHHRIDAWLASLPPGVDPQVQDLQALGARPIPGKAGDLIIWHGALPHGGSPNRAARPRVSQYLWMFPTRR
ncbi:ectoine hydroxylase-related dioxygenase (phytanoyl-CoA dioxygenase family) [Caulobacter ginsengisoli]|uniref:Ectoine hydroxylase-related dioxygenase (Phytanoyl-CoA dioxygenase family) n=1 Tax=Caulobacter ginsengisoli TaxID=400775 RepID=A0ABU0INI2_9CAUL|nr:phytanoyl-CoA dioxygenase family protein [Caulobacter ginsengisoli]MDQ0462733.1 ectoine hydroxylase-related dioxygenase (phytanoyl-CoA dioxygenase family) [Caulobacter ginsengisoli]